MNQKITFKVNDMHCESCPKVISMDLEDIPGVSSVNASFDTKLVTIEFDPGITNQEKLVEVIKTSGYSPVIPN